MAGGAERRQASASMHADAAHAAQPHVGRRRACLAGPCSMICSVLSAMAMLRQRRGGVCVWGGDAARMGQSIDKVLAPTLRPA